MHDENRGQSKLGNAVILLVWVAIVGLIVATLVQGLLTP